VLLGVYWAGSIKILSPRAWFPSGLELFEIEERFAEEGPLCHELSHLLTDRITRGNYSRWLTEGLAQYIEKKLTGFTLEEPSPEAKANPYPFARLDAGFDRQPDQVLAYWQSLQAVTYLIEEFGMEKLHSLAEQFTERPDPLMRSLRKTYGLSLPALEEAVKNQAASG
jgi:hypothetical protein